MKTLKQYAKEHGIQYRAAWNRFNLGKIKNAFKDEFGKVLIKEEIEQDNYIVCCFKEEPIQDSDTRLKRLIDFVESKGYIVKGVLLK